MLDRPGLLSASICFSILRAAVTNPEKTSYSLSSLTRCGRLCDVSRARDAPPSLVTISRRLGLGYSSQDWILTPDYEEVLLDVNPAGQWLFLPESIGSEVSRAIATWLSER